MRRLPGGAIVSPQSQFCDRDVGFNSGTLRGAHFSTCKVCKHGKVGNHDGMGRQERCQKRVVKPKRLLTTSLLSRNRKRRTSPTFECGELFSDAQIALILVPPPQGHPRLRPHLDKPLPHSGGCLPSLGQVWPRAGRCTATLAGIAHAWANLGQRCTDISGKARAAFGQNGARTRPPHIRAGVCQARTNLDVPPAI